jgi:anti-sigma regulatory factor (Ser/Thr protein kinase)
MSSEPSVGPPEAPDAAVTLRFTPLPEHVRTARLVATAVARRIGLVDDQLDAVRLAVGEACARAVQRTESAPGAAAGELVSLRLTHRPVGDRVHLEAVVVDGAGDDGVETEDVAMLLMEGLADQVLVGAGPGGPGGTTRLVWTALDRTT